jgi:hypothetical protein
MATLKRISLREKVFEQTNDIYYNLALLQNNKRKVFLILDLTSAKNFCGCLVTSYSGMAIPSPGY